MTLEKIPQRAKLLDSGLRREAQRPKQALKRTIRKSPLDVILHLALLIDDDHRWVNVDVKLLDSLVRCVSVVIRPEIFSHTSTRKKLTQCLGVRRLVEIDHHIAHALLSQTLGSMGRADQGLHTDPTPRRPKVHNGKLPWGRGQLLLAIGHPCEVHLRGRLPPLNARPFLPKQRVSKEQDCSRHQPKSDR